MKIHFPFQVTRPTSAILLSATLAACAIHPVQKDATGFRTVDIVDRIRCETRLAIQDKVIELLSLPERDGRSRQIAEALRNNRALFLQIKPADLSTDDERAFYFRYIKTGIAYDFTFDITEDNKASAAVDPVKLITNGTVGIGFTGSGEFARQNSRHFVMSDTFENLLKNAPAVCDDNYKSENFIYPIAGSVGMTELIGTFIDLNEDKNLAPLAAGNSRVFADTLTFTTTITGSASPHVTLSPVGTRLGLASPASFTAFGSRVDKHQMIVGLSMDSSAPVPKKLTAGVFSGFVQPRSALAKTSVTPTEQRALEAVSQQRLDTFYDRFGTVLAR